MNLMLDDALRRMRDALAGFLDRAVRPAEAVYRQQLALQDDPWHWTAPAVLGDLREQAQELGLWNLFLPGDQGAGLTAQEYVPLATLAAQSPIGPVAINCAAPDTGVMNLLAEQGTASQQRRWLQPLLAARVRSALAAAPAGTSIVRDGDECVVSGLQPGVPGALNPDARIFLVAAEAEPEVEAGLEVSAPRRRRHVVVPRSAAGVTVRRSTWAEGARDDRPPGGVATLVLDEVRVPVTNLLGFAGDGAGDGGSEARGDLGLDQERRTG
ncbi:acyl-CoA dehydrogenase family protein [Aeromicrobium sp.]|uniref:acyl-CoA dehydrogenase family protein n=1 Tax=Aeromicrobium sp. TaxID=1871063 RepID=UPI0025BB0B84|nr:acyl-CoA dehydrogenase family protein [Aeromicrobium sp.]MCK5892790.1 acyl-CoA dehydrogenase family protein [Aeromicrobium sp.]